MKNHRQHLFGLAGTLGLLCLTAPATMRATDLTVDNLTVNSNAGIGTGPGILSLVFPAAKSMGSPAGDFTVQAGNPDTSVPGSLMLRAGTSYQNAGMSITLDGRNGVIRMDDDDGDSFAMGEGDNHFYANHTDLVLTSENAIKLVSESPMAVHGYSSGLDTIIFDGDIGAASFANGKVNIDGDGNVGIGTTAGTMNLAFPAGKSLGAPSGDLTVQAGNSDANLQGTLTLRGATGWSNAGTTLTVDGRRS